MDDDTFGEYDLIPREEGQELTYEESTRFFKHLQNQDYPDVVLLDTTIPTTIENFDAVITDFIEHSYLEGEGSIVRRINRHTHGKRQVWNYEVFKIGKYRTIGVITLIEINQNLANLRIEVQFDMALLFHPYEDQVAILFRGIVDLLNRFSDRVKQLYGITEKSDQVDEVRYTEKKKPGRPHYEEDIWAHNEVKKHPEMREAIYYEWLKKTKEVKEQRLQRELADPKRHFRIITKKEWLGEEKEET